MSSKGTAIFAAATLLLVAFTALSYLDMDEATDADGYESSESHDGLTEGDFSESDQRDADGFVSGEESGSGTR